jgi:nitroreductase
MSEYPTIPLVGYKEFPIEEMRQRLNDFYAEMNSRRTVRDFSDRPVPKDIIETALKVANTAPSGANLQPWHFAVISGPETKKVNSTRTVRRLNGWPHWSLSARTRTNRSWKRRPT